MKLFHRVPEAAEALGIGRTRLYELMASGALESVHDGRRRLIPTEALESYAQSLRDSQKVAS